MLNRYSAIAIAFLSFGAQDVFAGNEQAQRMVLGGVSVEGPTLPAASTYKPGAKGHDQARALLDPVFVSETYVGASKTVGIVAVDGHEQARRMIVGQ